MLFKLIQTRIKNFKIINIMEILFPIIKNLNINKQPEIKYNYDNK